MRGADGPVCGTAHLTLPGAAAPGPLPLPPEGRRGALSLVQPGGEATHPRQGSVEVEIADFAEECASLLHAQCALQQLLRRKRAIERFAVAVGQRGFQPA